jgi:hypothetical protein
MLGAARVARLAQHPEILRAVAVGQAHDRGLGRLPDEPAGQHVAALVVDGDEGAHRPVHRLQATTVEAGRGRQRARPLGDPEMALARQKPPPGIVVGEPWQRIDPIADDARVVPGRQPAHHPAGLVEHPCLGRRVAEPESGRLAQHCGLAEQRFGQRAGVTGERPVLQHAGAQAIGDHGAAEPGGLHEARGAATRPVRQVQGIGISARRSS